MKKRQHLREQLVTALEVPRDLACKETIVTFTGKNHAVIENYRSILRYTGEEIVVLTYLRPRAVVEGRPGVNHCIWKKAGNSMVYFG